MDPKATAGAERAPEGGPAPRARTRRCAMTKMRPWIGLLAALGLAVSGTLTGATVAGPALATTHTAARTAAVPSCTASALNVHKGRLEGAAGSRFQTVRVTNDSARPCATPGWTRYRFARNGSAIGFRSP